MPSPERRALCTQRHGVADEHSPAHSVLQRAEAMAAIQLLKHIKTAASRVPVCIVAQGGRGRAVGGERGEGVPGVCWSMLATS